MTMPITTNHLDAKTTLELLDKAVEERGADWVYPGTGAECTYFVSGYSRNHFPDSKIGAPACLVGFVIAELGVTVDDIGEANEGVGAQTLALDYLSEIGLDVDHLAVDLLVRAQTCQDTGETWGEAVAAAHQEFEDQK